MIEDEIDKVLVGLLTLNQMVYDGEEHDKHSKEVFKRALDILNEAKRKLHENT